MTTVSDIGNGLDVLAEILERWERKLRQLTEELEGAEYAAETDEALNLEAVVQSRISAALDDEMRPVIETLKDLASLIEKENPKPN